MEEIWKDVVGYEGLYEVSNLGRVRSVFRLKTVSRNGIVYDVPYKSKVLRPQQMKHGYVGVWLYGKGGASGKNGKQIAVHRIVADAFCHKDSGDCEVNHLNEDKSDNRACNLEWCTHKENSSYGTRGERIGKANKNGKQSKAVVQLTLDGKFVAQYPSLAEIRRRTGFNHKNICRLLKGYGETSYGYKWQYANDYNSDREAAI